MDIKIVAGAVHDLAVKKGWWPNQTITRDEILSKIALIHSELSEALEIARESDFQPNEVWHSAKMPGQAAKPEGFGIELADAVIRIFDLAEALNVNIEKCIMDKHEYNETREFRHGGKGA